MNTTDGPARGDASASLTPIGKMAVKDDLETARRRMKHLARWHVEPMPMTQQTASAPAVSPVSAATKARRKRVALEVLALQMVNARLTSALS